MIQQKLLSNSIPNLLAQPRRFYMAGLGRFTTRVREQEWIAGENPYGYANGNPVTWIDPDGNRPLTRFCPPPPKPKQPLNCKDKQNRQQWNKFIYAYCNCSRRPQEREMCDVLAANYYLACKGTPGQGTFAPPPGPMPGPGMVTPWRERNPIRRCDPQPYNPVRIDQSTIPGEMVPCGKNFCKDMVLISSCFACCDVSCRDTHPGYNDGGPVYTRETNERCKKWCVDNAGTDPDRTGF
jgi:hypothetical protein